MTEREAGDVLRGDHVGQPRPLGIALAAIDVGVGREVVDELGLEVAEPHGEGVLLLERDLGVAWRADVVSGRDQERDQVLAQHPVAARDEDSHARGPLRPARRGSSRPP